MTRTRSIVGKCSSKEQHDGHRDVVGQVGDERGRGGAGQLRDGRASAATSAKLVGVVRLEPSATVAGERAGEPRVDLDGGHVLDRRAAAPG